MIQRQVKQIFHTFYYDFYQQEQDFDVLFLGTSHVLNAVYPMELWRDYGIVSYNMANHSENICTLKLKIDKTRSIIISSPHTKYEDKPKSRKVALLLKGGLYELGLNSKNMKVLFFSILVNTPNMRINQKAAR